MREGNRGLALSLGYQDAIEVWLLKTVFGRLPDGRRYPSPLLSSKAAIIVLFSKQLPSYVSGDYAGTNRELAGCVDLKSCSAVAELRTSLAPAAHFHIDAEMAVSIYNQSSTL
jgi:hypothetical protein